VNLAPTPSRRAQLRALLISLAAFVVPVAGVFWFPTGMGTYEALLWLVALVPAFLLAYERGWRGAATALAFGMAVLSVTYAFARIFHHAVPADLWAIVLIYVGVTLAFGWLVELMARRRMGPLHTAAFVDHLSGLTNRRFADIVLTRQFAAAARGRAFAVVLFQIDDYQGLRSRRGMAAANEALGFCAERLARATRKMDVSARYREDAFLSILDGADAEGAFIFAQRVLALVRSDAFVTALRRPSMSAGVAAFHPALARPAELLSEAESALGDARRAGGDRVRLAERIAGRLAEVADRAAPPRSEPTHAFPGPTSAQQYLNRDEPLGRDRRVLVYSADALVRERMSKELQTLGFDVCCAESPEAASELVNPSLDLLVIDLAAGPPALALTAEVRARFPATRILGLPPDDRPRVQPDYLAARVEAFFVSQPDGQAGRSLGETLAELLAERDWITRTAMRNRQLTDELRAASRETQIAKRRTEEILNRSQKMDAIGRLAGGIAHDFNNLMTTVQGHTELLISELPEGDRIRAELMEIREAADRATALTRQLLAFSSQQVLQPKVIDLRKVVLDLERILRRVIGEDVELVIHQGDEPIYIRADPAQIDQVLLNLAVNAREAMPEGGRLTITLATEAFTEPNEMGLGLEPGGYALLSVTDTGHGMDEATASKIFEPFFTTKPAGKGTGLGLSTAYGIVNQSGGHIAVESEIGHGTTFRVLLPRVEAPPLEAEVAAPATPTLQPHRTGTVLLVEDEGPVRSLVSRILTRGGFRVLPAASGTEALQLVQGDEHLDLLVSDVIMPGMGGPELARHTRELRPGIPVLFISGYSKDAVSAHGALIEGAFFLEKPFTPDDLVNKVREALAGR
jgi:diguanylate cyclase (GGDEF)-like protein